jgi:hypothetical protein
VHARTKTERGMERSERTDRRACIGACVRDTQHAFVSWASNKRSTKSPVRTACSARLVAALIVVSPCPCARLPPSVPTPGVLSRSALPPLAGHCVPVCHSRQAIGGIPHEGGGAVEERRRTVVDADKATREQTYKPVDDGRRRCARSSRRH